MQDLMSEVIEVLKQDQRFYTKGKLLKNKIMETALRLDKDLIHMLLNREEIKNCFFIELDNVLVFDKEKFIRFINNKSFLPDSYTTFKNKVGLTVDNEYMRENRNVVLAWPYKDCVLEGGQKEESKRNEVFYNEILAPDEIDRLLEPKVLTNIKKIDKNGETRNPVINLGDNFIIKGNNLLALHSIKKRFAGKVKLIYIDPPYNTGSDSFKYNDRFNQSTWLTFMKNRLEAARELLRKDGIIFIQIDDNEVAYLKLLCDEIFGKENFIQFIEIKANVGAANEYQNPFMPKNCEYGLLYAKDKRERKYKPLWIPAEWDQAYNKIILNPNEKDFTKWEIGRVWDEIKKQYGDIPSEEQVQNFVILNSYRIFQTIYPKGAGKGLQEAMGKSKIHNWSIYKREDKEDILCFKGRMVRFYDKNLKEINGRKMIVRELGSLWTDMTWMGIANEGGVKLKNGKKPEKLLHRIIEMNTEKGDLVLDFFLGSGTTCAVAHKMGRQYIGIEQLDYGDNDSLIRLKNVINGDKTGISKQLAWQGGGSFIYCELMKWNQVFIEKIQEANDTEELKTIWNVMKEKAFLSYKVELQKFEDNIDEFEKLNLENQQLFLLECLDKNDLYVNLSEIDDAEYNISPENKDLNNRFYSL